MIQKFDEKWKDIFSGKSPDEFSLYVARGAKPKSQRQINLFWCHQFIKKIIRGKNYTTGLELGSGRGTTSLYLNLYEGIDVTMLDISEEAIAVARKIFASAGAKGNFIVADCAALPFPDNHFDIVYSVGLLEHLPNYKKTMAESRRVLRDGGVMIFLNIPAKWSAQNINNVYKKILTIVTGREYPPKDYYRNSDKPKDYENAAREVGFKNVYTINVNPFPIFVPISSTTDRMIAELYKLIILIRSIFMSYPFKTNYWLSQAHFLVGYK